MRSPQNRMSSLFSIVLPPTAFSWFCFINSVWLRYALFWDDGAKSLLKKQCIFFKKKKPSNCGTQKSAWNLFRQKDMIVTKF
jgi:hypothetical protein